jgi:predicted ABC-type ATPase
MPQFILIGGPNGAGKSTSSVALVPPGVPYINADEIAKGLAGQPDVVNKDIQASRFLLAEWDRMESERADFAIETTLASRSLAPKIRRLQESGYKFVLYFFWLPSADMAIARVAERVRRGGHNIPEDVIRRRYEGGIRNFFGLYQEIADEWVMFANLQDGQTVLVANGHRRDTETVLEHKLWWKISERHIMEQNKVREMPAAYGFNWREQERAVQRAVRAALIDHKQAGNPIAVWRDDRVVIVPPEEINIPEEESLVGAS